MSEIDVSQVNHNFNSLTTYGRDLEQRKREQINHAAQTVAIIIDDLAVGWGELGLSDREAEVAAYRQLGFTNKATAHMLELSVNTVNEYVRRVNQKISRAQALLQHADRTNAFDKHWRCHKCREKIQRSKASIEVDTDNEKIHYQCNNLGCYEEHSIPIYDSPQAE